MVAEAIRIQGMIRLPDDPAGALEHADRCEVVADAHGLREASAWTDYLRTEAWFLSGRWDDALEAGTRAVDLGERNAYHRVTVRTWHVLAPMAWARGDEALLRRIDDWFVRHDALVPDTPYARFTRGAVEVLLGHAGVAERFVPDLEHLRASIVESAISPSWYAGAETLFDGWVWAGELDAAYEWLERFALVVEQEPTGFGLALADLLLARRRAHGDPGAAIGSARAAADAFARIPAPWWQAKAIRVIDALGAAGDDERDRAAAIEATLGISPPS